MLFSRAIGKGILFTVGTKVKRGTLINVDENALYITLNGYEHRYPLGTVDILLVLGEPLRIKPVMMEVKHET